MREELELLAANKNNVFKLALVIEDATEDWKGERGLISTDIIIRHCPPPSEGLMGIHPCLLLYIHKFNCNIPPQVLACGPAGFEGAVELLLQEIGYSQQATYFF